MLLIDLHKPSQALIYALRALEIRKTHFGTIHPRVASVYNILGTIYTALYPDLETLKKGMEYHRMALDIRLKHDHAKIGNTYSNMCSHLLRMGDHDGAENMLAKCPALVNFSDETFLKQTNPRFTRLGCSENFLVVVDRVLVTCFYYLAFELRKVTQKKPLGSH